MLLIDVMPRTMGLIAVGMAFIAASSCARLGYGGSCGKNNADAWLGCDDATSAKRCVGGSLEQLSCPLGCDPSTQTCATASNISVDLVGQAGGVLDLGGASSPVTIDTTTGEISGIRGPGLGTDAGSGIVFTQVGQNGGPALGVFSVKRFTLPAGVTLDATGSAALVIVASGPIAIGGTLDAGAQGSTPGPGGYAGGPPGVDGSGPGGGMAGAGYCSADNAACSSGCSSGAAGGGFGGTGGDGSASTITASGLATNPGGSAQPSEPGLSPLVGGSGGAGSAALGTYSGPNTIERAAGGGGGGAVQLVSTTEIRVSGVITVPGDGGGEVMSGGGAAGGAGGAILLEAPSVSIASTGVLAANGGGGGGGDCL